MLKILSPKKRGTYRIYHRHLQWTCICFSSPIHPNQSSSERFYPRMICAPIVCRRSQRENIPWQLTEDKPRPEARIYKRASCNRCWKSAISSTWTYWNKLRSKIYIINEARLITTEPELNMSCLRQRSTVCLKFTFRRKTETHLCIEGLLLMNKSQSCDNFQFLQLTCGNRSCDCRDHW